MSHPETIKTTQLEKQVEDSEKAFRANLEAYNEMRSECGRLQSELSATTLELAIEREARQQASNAELWASDRAAKLAHSYDYQTKRMVALREAAERVVDVFYVKDAFGLKITSDRRIKVIRKQLLDAIVPGGFVAETGGDVVENTLQAS